MVGWDFSSVPPRKPSWISFDSSENLQKGQRSAQNFVPPKSQVESTRSGFNNCCDTGDEGVKNTVFMNIELTGVVFSVRLSDLLKLFHENTELVTCLESRSFMSLRVQWIIGRGIGCEPADRTVQTPLFKHAHQFLTIALTAMSWIDLPTLDISVRSARRLMDPSFDKSDRCTKITSDQETHLIRRCKNLLGPYDLFVVGIVWPQLNPQLYPRA